jgi:hypothetical protein
MTDLALIEEQARKAATWFGKAVREHGQRKMAFEQDGTLIVIADGPAAQLLRILLDKEDFLPHGVSMVKPPVAPVRTALSEAVETPKPDAVKLIEGALEPRYHIPGSQVYEGSRGKAKGNIHLHVTGDMTLGRRARTRGQCLCSKKNGSMERPPDPDEKKMCPECVKVAADNGLAWSL